MVEETRAGMITCGPGDRWLSTGNIAMQTALNDPFYTIGRGPAGNPRLFVADNIDPVLLRVYWKCWI